MKASSLTPRLFATRLFVFALFTVFGAGCSTPVHKLFDRLEVGQDKAEVLEVAGPPKHSVRSKGRDVWIYRYYKEESEHRRTLVFEQGKLTVVGPESRILDPKENMIESELENLDKTGQPKGSFKTLD